MPRAVFLIFLVVAIPWAIATWWKMARAQSARERAWLARTSIGVWLLSLLGAVSYVLIAMRGPALALIAVPLYAAVGAGVRHALKKMRAQIRDEEGDPVSRAKPLN